MKKKIFALAVIAVCLSILASVTVAYFTDIFVTENVIEAGAIQITVVQQQESHGIVTDCAAGSIPIMPGETVSRIVSVRSDEQSAFIRMRYGITILDADGKQMDLDAETLRQVIGITPDANSWILRDGWWYFSSPVKTGQHTEPLFSQICFSGPDMNNNYQNCSVLISIDAQAVQQANNGADALEALGWPAE